MRFPIRPIGSCIFTKKDGYLYSDFDIRKLQDQWLVPVNRLVKELVDSNKYQIISIYLRGSIATGNAVENISDVDIFVITEKILVESEVNNINKLANVINGDHPFITRFDIGFYTREQIVKSKERVLIKLRSLCVFGEDFSSEIPNLKPGTDIAVTLLGLEKEIEKIKCEINENFYNQKNTKATCKWFMKRILRAGLELVSVREGCYTRDLYKCWYVFSKYYPQYESEMYKVLDLAINPTDLINEVKSFIPLADFIITEAKKINIMKITTLQ